MAILDMRFERLILLFKHLTSLPADETIAAHKTLNVILLGSKGRKSVNNDSSVELKQHYENGDIEDGVIQDSASIEISGLINLIVRWDGDISERSNSSIILKRLINESEKACHQ